LLLAGSGRAKGVFSHTTDALRTDIVMSVSQSIGFIGAGMMAEALASGFIDKGVIQAKQVYCNDPTPARQDVFRKMGCNPLESGKEVRHPVLFWLCLTSSGCSHPPGPLIRLAFAQDSRVQP
jgi:NADP oxidoreductase coenzyme F420-dependent